MDYKIVSAVQGQQNIISGMNTMKGLDAHVRE